MSETMRSALIAGLIAIVIWFGFNIGFDGDAATSFIGAPIFFAIAFGIGVVIGRLASRSKTKNAR